jgi:hypothetical protein
MKLLPVFLTLAAALLVALLPACQSPPPPPVPVDEQATLAVLLETLQARIDAASTGTPGSYSLVRDFVPQREAVSATRYVTAAPSSTPTQIPPTPTVTPTRRVFAPPPPSPQEWQDWPVVPRLSQKAFELYWEGRQKGVNGDVFSVVGDCQSEPDVFLGVYDKGGYELGEEYAYLQETIDFYKGSFYYLSPSVVDGLNVSGALSPYWADKSVCLPDESPVACELRLRRPSIVLVNLGTNWDANAIGRYEGYLRTIVDLILESGALPVLSTKVDNIEGDHSINLAIARVAYEYELPLWNFWLAAQDLPNGGLDAYRDNIHLSVAGWNLHSFSALEVLDSLRRELGEGADS